MPYDPHGLVLIADDDEISRSSLARAIQAEGTNSRTFRFDPIAYAGTMLIRQACQRLGQTHLRGFVLYSSSEPTTPAHNDAA